MVAVNSHQGVTADFIGGVGKKSKNIIKASDWNNDTDVSWCILNVPWIYIKKDKVDE